MTPVAVRIEFVFIDFAAQRVAVDPKNSGGARLIAVRAVENPLDESFFEFADCFVEQNSALYH